MPKNFMVDTFSQKVGSNLTVFLQQGITAARNAESSVDGLNLEANIKLRL
jgi:hypothetical protein